MAALTPYFVDLLAPFTLAMQVITVVLFILYVQTRQSKKKCSGIIKLISDHGLLLMFLAAFSAVLGSLFFSEIALWTPCKYCWIQRIFMFPLAFILGLALVRRDRTITPYVLLLSFVGLLVSVFHYGEQIQSKLNPAAFDPLQPCDLTGISCRTTYVDFAYGYITIPMMALTLFAFTIVASLIMLQCDRKAVRKARS